MTLFFLGVSLGGQLIFHGLTMRSRISDSLYTTLICHFLRATIHLYTCNVHKSEALKNPIAWSFANA